MQPVYRTASRATDTVFSYFSSSVPPESPPYRRGPGQARQGSEDAIESEYRGQSQYSPSIASSRPSTALITGSTTTSRPTTPSRRSRSGATPSILGQSESHDVVCAVSEARSVAPTVGIATVNLSLGEATLSQICDNQSYVKTIHKLQLASPSRIVFMPSACSPNEPSTFFTLVQRLIPEAELSSHDRSAWSESAGVEFIEHLAPEGDVGPIKVAIHGKYYAVCCFSAAMKYIDHQFSISFSPQSLRIRYQPSEDTMMIDISAMQSLEVMRNLKSAKSKECLFGLLNHTLTPMGSRVLRNNMLQPPTDFDGFIRTRYDALEEMVTNEEMFHEIRKALKLFHDIEKTLTKAITIRKNTGVFAVEEQITHILMIKSFLESVPELYRALHPAKSDLLVKIRNLCRPETTVPILLSIRKVIEADVTYMKSPLDLRNQRAFAVKSGISGMLDVARQTYRELTEVIHAHLAEVSEDYRVAASLKFDNRRMYWFRIPTADLDMESIPPEFINVIPKKNHIECQTLDLVKLNQRLLDTSNEIIMRSDAAIRDLVKELRRQVSPLFRVCESIALVDMISSFGQVTTTRDYVRPGIEDTLALKSARHPILDKKMASDYVPNDYYASQHHRFHCVTGCNMSGKSTYIRSVALLQIMAQIGCFVPAEFATFPIIHNIFARISAQDNIEANLSSFGVEMREMAFILKNIDSKSLAIIDELGRGTSVRDGMAIAMAISEALIDTGASIWFATHFVELARILADCPGVLNLHLASNTSVGEGGIPQLTMLYNATAGIVDDEHHYGIALARAIGMPDSFIKCAEYVSNDLRKRRESSRQSSEYYKEMQRNKLVQNLHEALEEAKKSSNKEALPGYLKRLEDEFILRLKEIDEM
ncbi:DNA mismatch repair protein [Trichoderma citrinoviride]|uniref:DNA mismatch repair protein MSH3 n=1 Tax=Trichoderma citrinoviride TaxID=58853 RepID=A0A2T4BCE4_9HYPO|nr:DNA mismatch repair protein [Trichoderma citrinoviride]PTB66869.1 DNA mismatch repair protein [Trichoderma citrinoviride]